MTTRSDNGVISAELSIALGTLCLGCLPAVRIACVPSGLEHRFVVSVDAGWRAQVYTALAAHIRIPPDAGPLNLSRREALRICEMAVAGESESATHVSRPHYRQPRRIALDLTDSALRETFQP